jgi:uncharacterized RDD family membrane protein YckC
MSWQPPEGDPPPPPAGTPADPRPTEPDAETARVPLTPEPPSGGIISAEPVGWTGPAQGTGTVGDPAAPGAETPRAAWVLPAGPVQVVEGLVIAGVFSRIVAYCVDLLLLSSLNLIAFGILGSIDQPRDGPSLILSAVLVGVDLLYFVGLWTSGLHGTLGMRMVRLRVLSAGTAKPISINDAVLRWIALTGAISILTLVPGIGPYVGLISLVWVLVLLVTTATNPLRQGIHDRWARSVVVQPAPGGSGLAFATCLVLVVLMGLLSFGLLALAGDQLRVILSQVGNSI